MTDRELMQMALRFFDWFYSDDHSIGREDFRATQKALRDRLAQPEPVHAIDISQERVDETAKRKHEWVGLDGDIPGLGLVTEEFYNGMLCAEDILRKKNNGS